MEKLFGHECEQAIRLLCKRMPSSEELTKPTLFHSIRTGVYLYHKNYPRDIVLAGFLHDIIEDTYLTADEIEKEFGKKVANLVVANSKDKSILESNERIETLIKQCIKYGEDALIVKAADVIDNFSYFSHINDKRGIDYCIRNTNIILKNIPNYFSDKIFSILRKELNRNIK